MPASRLEAMVLAGQLIKAKTFHGRTVFDPAVVETQRRRLEAQQRDPREPARPRPHDGAAHAKAFRMFAEGKSSRDVVIECELPAPTVVELRRQYAEMGADFLISRAALEELRDLLDWRGVANERNFMAALRARLRDAFARGQRVATDVVQVIAEGLGNHTTGGDASGNTDGRTEIEGGQGRDVEDEIEGSLHGDRVGETAPGSGPRHP